MSEIRVILLCNHRFAIPAIRELLFFDNLAAILIPGRNKDLAEELGLEIGGRNILHYASRENLTERITHLAEEKSLSAAFMLGFPYKIPPAAVQAFPRGFFNFHFGPLPRYPGPEPLFTQLQRGEKTTGVFVHRVTDEIDRGPLCIEESIRLDENATYGMVQTQLAWISAALARELVQLMKMGVDIPARPQDTDPSVWCARPGLADVFIRFGEMDSVEIRRLVNACNPWNKGAGCRIGDRIFGILEVEITGDLPENKHVAGTIVSLNSGGLFVSTKDGKLIKLNVIYSPEGFISGSRIQIFGIREGNRFE